MFRCFIVGKIYVVIWFFNQFYQSHNDALDDHRRIPMVEYQKEYRKLETRYCVTHTRYKYGMGCEKCYRVFCVECVAEAGSCKNGKMQKRPIILHKYDTTMYWALSNLSFVLTPLRCHSVMCQFLGDPMSGKKICWAITMEPVYLKDYVNISFFQNATWIKMWKTISKNIILFVISNTISYKDFVDLWYHCNTLRISLRII